MPADVCRRLQLGVSHYNVSVTIKMYVARSMQALKEEIAPCAARKLLGENRSRHGLEELRDAVTQRYDAATPILETHRAVKYQPFPNPRNPDYPTRSFILPSTCS